MPTAIGAELVIASRQEHEESNEPGASICCCERRDDEADRARELVVRAERDESDDAGPRRRVASLHVA